MSSGQRWSGGECEEVQVGGTSGTGTNRAGLGAMVGLQGEEQPPQMVKSHAAHVP